MASTSPTYDFSSSQENICCGAGSPALDAAVAMRLARARAVTVHDSARLRRHKK
jgi:hypothetical protein